MKHILLFTTIVAWACSTLLAQDKVTLKSGVVFNSYGTTVEGDRVYYRDHPESNRLVVFVMDVYSIQFEDGKTIILDQQKYSKTGADKIPATQRESSIQSEPSTLERKTHKVSTDGVVYFAFSGILPTSNYSKADASYGHRLDWGLNKESRKGGAGFGIGGHMGAWLGIPRSNGLKVGYDIAFTYTWMNSDIKDYYDDYLDDVEDYIHDYATYMSDYKLSLPKYFLAPFTFGLRYDIGRFDISGGIGFSMNLISNMKETWLDHGDKAHSEVMYNINMFSFAWRVGFGVRVTDKYSIMISYYNLGDLKISYKKNSYNYYSHHGSTGNRIRLGNINPTMFAITIRRDLR